MTELRTVGEIELSAQRLDLEGKHSTIVRLWKVTATWQIQTADIYRTSIDPECPESLCVIYEENAIVKYPGRVCIDSGQTCLII